ncbi:hypothetical protein ACFZA2_06270 [Microbacterium sp. NPDC007973]|uniref:hypothetical protein n=1 Tax=Microbacterium sp. NPDC007973 TaxID=3364182 RepID=UPI0036F159E4
MLAEGPLGFLTENRSHVASPAAIGDAPPTAVSDLRAEVQTEALRAEALRAEAARG